MCIQGNCRQKNDIRAANLVTMKLTVVVNKRGSNQ